MTDENKPLINKFASVYKILEDNTELLISQKDSYLDSSISFLLPEGNYTYVTSTKTE